MMPGGQPITQGETMDLLTTLFARARKTAFPMLLFPVFAVAALTAQSALAQDSATTAAVRGTCSLATVKGSYGVLATGQILGVGPTTASGVFRTDGNGHFVYQATQNIAGTVSTFSVNGTYTLNADCMGVATYANGATYTAVVVEGGREIYLQSTTTNPQLVETAVAKRL
jgi:hypothetical protein